MPFGIGLPEILILLLVALLIFGPKRLPEMGRSLGRGMREFKDSVSGKDFGDDDDENRRELTAPREDSTPVKPRERDSVS
jgi:sec-independent protein translocase protein TatA